MKRAVAQFTWRRCRGPWHKCRSEICRFAGGFDGLAVAQPQRLTSLGRKAVTARRFLQALALPRPERRQPAPASARRSGAPGAGQRDTLDANEMRRFTSPYGAESWRTRQRRRQFVIARSPFAPPDTSATSSTGRLELRTRPGPNSCLRRRAARLRKSISIKPRFALMPRRSHSSSPCSIARANRRMNCDVCFGVPRPGSDGYPLRQVTL
jgi:hypothetical protein